MQSKDAASFIDTQEWHIGVTRMVECGADMGCGPGQTVPDSSWQIKPEDIEICQKPDGSGDWQLGSGGFGKVRPALGTCLRGIDQPPQSFLLRDSDEAIWRSHNAESPASSAT